MGRTRERRTRDGQTNFRRGRLRFLLWRWHRRIGLVSAAFVLLLAVTGILLNHSDSIGLDEAPLGPQWLNLFYSVDPPSATSFETGHSLITQWGARALYRNGEPLSDCRGELRGVLDYYQYEVVACEQELIILLAESGAVVERVDPVRGLPAPVERLGMCPAGVCVQSGEQIRQLDADEVTWTPVAVSAVSRWSTPVPTPDVVRDELVSQHVGQSISWERLLLDLHSGRLLGSWGVYLMDLMAVFFILLAGTGIVVWLLARRGGTKP
ncbi:PepSY domain-containing protein [Proteobacteria bacterium 005FR1]|nr:PepSY domain-containing protein [Proteobacteria bacterium 005FR1]